MFKKISLGLIALAFAALASAQTNTLTNEVRIMSTTQTFAAVNAPNGTSMSDVKSTAGGTANGSIAIPAPGQLSLSGDVAGHATLVGYNVSTQGGQGSFDGRVWTDQRVFGDLATVIPSGNGKIALDVEAGMTDPYRNGSDVALHGGTSTDGVAQAMNNGGAAIKLTMSAAPAYPGTAVQGNIDATTYQHSEAATGAVTFIGGTPIGQSAALRVAQAGVVVNISGDLTDPVK